MESERMNNSLPKVSLFNVDDDVITTLSKAGFNTNPHKLNGKHYFHREAGFTNKSYDFTCDIPSDLHESDIVVIDTQEVSTLKSHEGNIFSLYSRGFRHILI